MRTLKAKTYILDVVKQPYIIYVEEVDKVHCKLTYSEVPKIRGKRKVEYPKFILWTTVNKFKKSYKKNKMKVITSSEARQIHKDGM